jgi:hypothetical protein
MIVDCDRCEVRGAACRDCVITALLGTPPGGVELDGAERQALDVLADAGMVARLQLVELREEHHSTQVGTSAEGCRRSASVKRSATDGERSRRQVS